MGRRRRRRGRSSGNVNRQNLERAIKNNPSIKNNLTSQGKAMLNTRRTASSAKEAASKLAQQRVNKSAQSSANKAANSAVAGKYQNQAQQTGQASGNRGKGGSLPTTPSGALTQGAPRPGRGRGKGSRPIAQNERTMQGGGFRNKAFGMGREQRGFGMGRMNMEQAMGNRAFGMGRDQRGMGMGREGMMRGRGFGSVAGERAKGGSRPTSGISSQGTPRDRGTRINSLGMEVPRGQQFRSKPAGMGRQPSRGYAPNHRGGGMAIAPQVSQRPQTSSFNPSTGRMEFASTPNNFSRGSQMMRMPFRKSMNQKGGFKLPPKSQIQK